MITFCGRLLKDPISSIICFRYALTRSNNNLHHDSNSDDSITSSFLPLDKKHPKSRIVNFNNNPTTASTNSLYETYRVGSGSDGDLTILQRQHRKQRYDREMRKSTLLKRFWNNRELLRNNSIEAIYQHRHNKNNCLSSGSSTTSMSSASTSPTRLIHPTRLRENVLMKNTRKEKFCSTSDLHMQQIFDKKGLHNSTPDISRPDITVTNRVWVNLNNNQEDTSDYPYSGPTIPSKKTTANVTPGTQASTPYFIQR